MIEPLRLEAGTELSVKDETLNGALRLSDDIEIDEAEGSELAVAVNGEFEAGAELARLDEGAASDGLDGPARLVLMDVAELDVVVGVSTVLVGDDSVDRALAVVEETAREPEVDNVTSCDDDEGEASSELENVNELEEACDSELDKAVSSVDKGGTELGISTTFTSDVCDAVDDETVVIVEVDTALGEGLGHRLVGMDELVVVPSSGSVVSGREGLLGKTAVLKVPENELLDNVDSVEAVFGTVGSVGVDSSDGDEVNPLLLVVSDSSPDEVKVEPFVLLEVTTPSGDETAVSVVVSPPATELVSESIRLSSDMTGVAVEAGGDVSVSLCIVPIDVGAGGLMAGEEVEVLVSGDVSGDAGFEASTAGELETELAGSPFTSDIVPEGLEADIASESSISGETSVESAPVGVTVAALSLSSTWVVTIVLMSSVVTVEIRVTSSPKPAVVAPPVSSPVVPKLVLGSSPNVLVSSGAIVAADSVVVGTGGDSGASTVTEVSGKVISDSSFPSPEGSEELSE